MDVASGRQKAILQSNAHFFASPAWMPDGSGLLGLLHEQSQFQQAQIAFVSYPGRKTFSGHARHEHVLGSQCGSERSHAGHRFERGTMEPVRDARDPPHRPMRVGAGVRIQISAGPLTVN